MFNSKEKLSVRFEKVSFRRTEDDKIAKIRLALPLEADTARNCPPEFRAAWEAIETRANLITSVKLDKQIEGVNIEFYALPDSKTSSLILESVELTNFFVEREDSHLRCETHLLFSIEISVKEKVKLRHWLVDACFTELFAKFEVAQLSLVSGDTQKEEQQESAIQ